MVDLSLVHTALVMLLLYLSLPVPQGSLCKGQESLSSGSDKPTEGKKKPQDLPGFSTYTKVAQLNPSAW